MFKGWPLVGVTIIVVSSMVALIFGIAGTAEEGVRMAIRATARTSGVLFLGAFVASALRRAVQNELSAWLLRNRRYLGVSFAASHAIHLALIIRLGMEVGAETFDAVTLYGGVLGYVFIALMTATSFDVTATWLGRRNWKRLHTNGMYVLWVIFVFTAIGGGLVTQLLGAALVIALGMRIAYRKRRPAVRDGVIG